jgi:shikimate 5-dehydrogenase
MLGVYRYRRIQRSTKVLGVLGNPVEHSKSPLLHNRAFEAMGLDFVYLKLLAENVDDFFQNAAAIGIDGCSVTIPFKTAAVSQMSDLTAEAKGAGAVNTVIRQTGGWVGDNTDVHGVRVALASVGFAVKGKRVVILGSGGASLAAQMAVKEAGSVVVLKRADLGNVGKYRCDLLINATPVGMYPAVDVSPVEGVLPADVVMDMVYTPAMTQLLRQAASQGKTIIPGTTMFLAQAARQFEIWTGTAAPSTIYSGQNL